MLELKSFCREIPDRIGNDGKRGGAGRERNRFGISVGRIVPERGRNVFVGGIVVVGMLAVTSLYLWVTPAGNGGSEAVEKEAGAEGTDGAVMVIEEPDEETCTDTTRYTSLEAALARPEEVCILDLSGQGLAEVPSGMFELGALAELHLNDNRIDEMPATIGGLDRLTMLDLRENRLEAMPAEIGSLEHLTHLYLGKNRLKELPGTVNGLTSLTDLDLSDNELEGVPAAVGDMTALRRLWLENNRLDEAGIPASFGTLTQLTDLYLSNNRLSKVPAAFYRLENLKSLYLDGNELGEAELKELREAVGDVEIRY